MLRQFLKQYPLSLLLKLFEERKKMEKAIILYVIIMGAWTVYLCFMNRDADIFWEKIVPTLVLGTIAAFFALWFGSGSEKSQIIGVFYKTILPSLVIGVTGAFLALLFGLKEEKKVIQFPTTITTQIKSGKVLEKYDKKYDKLYGCRWYQARRYIKPLQEQKETIVKCYTHEQSGLHDEIFYSDITFLETLGILFNLRDERWEVSEGQGYPWPITDQLFSGHLYTITWHDFISKYLSTNRPEIKELCSQIDDPNIAIIVGNELFLPKGTNISATCKKYSGNIKIKNDFCVVNIETCFLTGSMGLGEWRWILGYDEEKSNEYYVWKNNIYLSVKYNKFRSGHPDMPKYKKWVESLFDRLHFCLDSTQQLEKARETHHYYKAEVDNYIRCLELQQKNKERKTDSSKSASN
jgi:hypothetical protein